MDRITLLKIFGLVIGCAAKFVTGSLFVFNVYQDDIKLTFNYTQKEVEALSSLLNVGLGIGFIPGMFYDRFGPGWTSAVGLVISVSAYLLIWSTNRFVAFYSSNSWLMAIYFLLCGFGSVFTYMVALNTNIINFDKKHTGKIVGLLNAFFAGSPSVYSAIYYNLFPQDKTVSVASSNFAGVMLMFAICFGAVDIMCILFIKRYDEPNPFKELQVEQQQDIQTPGGSKETAIAKSIAYDSISSNQSEDLAKVMRNMATRSSSQREAHDLKDTPLTITQILLNIDYQIFLWMIAFATTVGLVFVNNVTTISKSLRLDSNDKYLTIIIPITNTLLSAGVGLVSDIFMHKFPRIWFIIFACLNLLLSQIVAVIWSEHFGLLALATALVGCSIGILWSVSPTILKETYYIGNLGRNWGMAIMVCGMLGFGAQEVFGALYDDAITTPGDTYCYGMSCIRGGLGLTISFAIMSVVLGCVIVIRKFCNRRETSS